MTDPDARDPQVAPDESSETPAQEGTLSGFFAGFYGSSQPAEPEPAPTVSDDRAEKLRKLDEEKAEFDRKFAAMTALLEEQEKTIEEESSKRKEVLDEEATAASRALVATNVTRAKVIPTMNTGMTRLVTSSSSEGNNIPVLSQSPAGIWQGVKEFHKRRARDVARMATAISRYPAAQHQIHTGPTYYTPQQQPGVVYQYPLYKAPELARPVQMTNGTVHYGGPVRQLANNEQIPVARSVGSAATLAVPGTTSLSRRIAQPQQHFHAYVPTAQPVQAAAPAHVTVVQQAPSAPSGSTPLLFPGPRWIFGG